MRPDGTRNIFRIQRLKDKLGNRSNASSEIEYDNTYAVMVGPEGWGVKTIVEMVNCTRLDCVLGTTSLMRQAVAQATHHAAYRAAFGRILIDQPLMQNVLADLAVESEAATVLALRLARAADEAPSDVHEAGLKRLSTAVGKYYVCKRGPMVAAEALECLGGLGYVEESIMPRLYREAPVNSVWEGSGNVGCLDVLRAMGKDPASVAAFFAEVGLARGGNVHLDKAVFSLQSELRDLDGLEGRARYVVERMAQVLQAALLVRHAPAAVSDAYCASRLGGEGDLTFGTLPRGADVAAIVTRARPYLD